MRNIGVFIAAFRSSSVLDITLDRTSTNGQGGLRYRRMTNRSRPARVPRRSAVVVRAGARGLMWIDVLAGMAQTKQVVRIGRRT